MTMKIFALVDFLIVNLDNLRNVADPGGALSEILCNSFRKDVTLDILFAG